MKRILLQNSGPDLKNTQRAIALGTVECEKLGVQDFTVVVATKKHFESTEIGRLLGDTAKKLAKGDAVKVDSQGHKVQLESVATIQKLHSARVVIGLHLTADDIQKLDDLLIDVLIYVPWSETEGQTWAAKWAAETFGAPNAVHTIDLTPAVVEALKDLTSSVNLSTGIQHSSDKRDAKKCFADLQSAGAVWKPAEIERWAVQHGWKAVHAEALASLSAEGNYGKAIADFNSAVELDPNFTSAYNHLAWTLATCPKATFRNGPQAVEAATKACDLSQWNDINQIDTLAAAYAEAGDFEKAVILENQVVANDNLAPEDVVIASDRLALYQSNQPYHREQATSPVTNQ